MRFLFFRLIRFNSILYMAANSEIFSPIYTVIRTHKRTHNNIVFIVILSLPGQMVAVLVAQMAPPPGVTAQLLLHRFHHKGRRKVHLTLSWRKDCWDTCLI